MLAIFINMSVPYYLGHSIPFIAGIVIGSIQLGATVDYAILLTTRFREEIRNGYAKFEAMEIAVRESAKSIITSGLAFFGSTVGVAVISEIEIIKSLSTMIARGGALISTSIILFILPGVLIASESFIKATSKTGTRVLRKRLRKEGLYMKTNKIIARVMTIVMVLTILSSSIAFAEGKVSKEETVYVNLNNKGRDRKDIQYMDPFWHSFKNCSR